MDSGFGFSILNASLALLAIAFLIGSIPFGVIVGRLFYRSDLRQSGSGNIGAANALRSYGKIGGAVVLLLDASKGFIVTSLAQPWPWEIFARYCLCVVVTSAEGGAAAVIGLAAVLGHCFSPWLRFRGGKGVATWLGVLFGLSWIAGVAFVVVWLLVVLPMRYASLGSMIASVLSPLALWFLSHDLVITGCATAAALLIVWKHRENITRLREGRENKITFRKASA